MIRRDAKGMFKASKDRSLTDMFFMPHASPPHPKPKSRVLGAEVVRLDIPQVEGHA